MKKKECAKIHKLWICTLRNNFKTSDRLAAANIVEGALITPTHHPIIPLSSLIAKASDRKAAALRAAPTENLRAIVLKAKIIGKLAIIVGLCRRPKARIMANILVSVAPVAACRNGSETRSVVGVLTLITGRTLSVVALPP